MAFLDYDLPPHLIAQQPASRRDESRLLVVKRVRGELNHRQFRELPDLLRPGDLLVLNDTRVLPARLHGRRARTGGRWEGLFLGARPDGFWELACQTRGTPIASEIIQIEPGPLQLELIEKTTEGHWLARPSESGSPADLLLRHGQMPLPPYIRKGVADPEDADRYQTVYARQPGAVAAPTAGLHFSPAIFDELQRRGVNWTYLTLHVGAGTFQPIRTGDFRQHVMHAEWGELSADAANAIRTCREHGGRVVAVGTTTVRVLETAAAGGEIGSWKGETRIFIYPPYEFKAVDALLTNFHLPRSTLLLLVGAFAGESLLRAAYLAAVEQQYRFYSYGDAMFIE
jgi:S-adenosylmethionine:tRNA ribosyltransferase-isomerase